MLRKLIVLLGVGIAMGWSGLSQITSPGTDYVSFWSGQLRIFAQQPDTEVLLIDIDTAMPLLLSDSRISTVNVASNPFTLSQVGDMFEGVGGLGGPNDEIRVRIVTSPAGGGDEIKPVTVWTGSIPTFGPTQTGDANENPWGSFLPASLASTDTFGREVGRNFIGFTQSQLILTAPRREGVTAELEIENLDRGTTLNLVLDNSIPECPALPIPYPNPACYLLDHPEVQVVFHNDYSNERVRVSSNVDMTVLTGHVMLTEVANDFEPFHTRTDWSSTPPSFNPGDDGRELGTLFYTVVREGLTVFPTQDDTNIEIFDLSDGDDSISVNLPHGDPNAPIYSIYTPFRSRFGRAPDGRFEPRNDSVLTLDVTDNAENPFDNDVVKVVSDKPVLLYLGPTGNDIREMADVAFSVATGPQSRVVFAYAQNFGDSNDFQLFVFQRDTQVSITSLSISRPPAVHHDFEINFDVPLGQPPIVVPGVPGSQYVAEATFGNHEHFGSGVWGGEMLKIQSDRPMTVIAGDYDTPNFGAYIPFVPPDRVLPPVARILASQPNACQGELISFDGSESFDQDPEGPPPMITRYDWDFGDGTLLPDAGPFTTHAFAAPGEYLVFLEVTDNELPPETQTDMGSETVTVLPIEDALCGGCGPCQGKVSELTLRYLGSISDARVEVFARRGKQRKDPAFDDIVQPGQTFVVTAPPDAPNKGFENTLGTEISIFVNGELNAKIHTSCSQPIGPGLIRGDFLVAGGTSKRGGNLCPPA